MKSIQNQYNQLLEGNLSQANFMRAVRMTFPQYITNVTSFNDSVKILKNKGILNEVLNEALNKDIKAFGQDLAKYLTNAGFKIKFLGGRISDEDMKQLRTNTGFVALEADQNPSQQSLYMHFNPKDVNKIEGIVNKFQLSPYSGKVMTTGWTSKQVVGALNPGDIYKIDGQKGSGLYQFFRLAKVDTKVANVTEAKKPEYQFNTVELAMGIKVEMEHTDDPKKAAKIAMDHLKENPSYYSQLKLSGIDSHQELPKAKAKSPKAPKKGELVDKENGMKVVKENLDTNKVYGGTGQNQGDTGSSIQFTVTEDTPEYFEIDFTLTPNSKYRQAGAGSRSPREKEYGYVKVSKADFDGYITAKGEKFYIGKDFITNNLQETKLNMFPGEEPNDTVKQAAQFIEMNNTLKQFSDKFVLQNIGTDNNRAVLRYSYWAKLPSTLLEKFKLQFNVEEDVEEHDDRLPTTAYILTPLRSIGKVDVGAAFDKFKATLENIVREVLEEENSK